MLAVQKSLPTLQPEPVNADAVAAAAAAVCRSMVSSECRATQGQVAGGGHRTENEAYVEGRPCVPAKLAMGRAPTNQGQGSFVVWPGESRRFTVVNLIVKSVREQSFKLVKCRYVWARHVSYLIFTSVKLGCDPWLRTGCTGSADVVRMGCVFCVLSVWLPVSAALACFRTFDR
jgi:hypothetical protein